MDVLMHSMSASGGCVTEAEKVWYLLGDIQITWQHCHLFLSSYLSSHHLLVFQSWVTLTRSILSKKHSSGSGITTHSGAWTLAFVWYTLFLFIALPNLAFLPQFSSVLRWAFPLSKVASDALLHSFFFFWEATTNFTEIKITIWMMYCANPFKSLQKQQKEIN